jgi:hypothetical protein
MNTMNATPTAEEINTFARAAKAALRKIAKHAADGGTYDTASKIEIGLARTRDSLEDKLRPLGLLEHAPSLALMEQVKQALRDCREAAAKVRRDANDAEIKRIDEEIRESRAQREAKCPGITAYENELKLSRR